VIRENSSHVSGVGGSIPSQQRVLSIDAVRGFALVVGLGAGDLIVPALKPLPSTPVVNVLIEQMTHAPWHGFHFIDLGYPAFVILLCSSMVFSFRKRRSLGQTTTQILWHVITRSALIYAFAFILYGGFSTSYDKIIVGHVFHQLAYCNLFAGLALLATTVTVRVVLLMVFLGGWWAILVLIPVPGVGTGDLSPAGNVLHYVLSHCPNKFVEFLVRTPRMFGTCLVGLLIGDWLANNRSQGHKTMGLFVFALVGLNLGAFWDGWLPINKLLWTPSFTLFSAGGTCAFLAVAHWLIEVLDRRRWLVPLFVVGRTPLAAWGLFHFLPLDDFSRRLAGDAFAPFFGIYHELILVLVQIVLWWLILYWIYRRNLILKI